MFNGKQDVYRLKYSGMEKKSLSTISTLRYKTTSKVQVQMFDCSVIARLVLKIKIPIK